MTKQALLYGTLSFEGTIHHVWRHHSSGLDALFITSVGLSWDSKTASMCTVEPWSNYIRVYATMRKNSLAGPLKYMRQTIKIALSVQLSQLFLCSSEAIFRVQRAYFKVPISILLMLWHSKQVNNITISYSNSLIISPPVMGTIPVIHEYSH